MACNDVLLCEVAMLVVEAPIETLFTRGIPTASAGRGFQPRYAATSSRHKICNQHPQRQAPNPCSPPVGPDGQLRSRQLSVLSLVWRLR
jgi:hypothetical protein